MPGDKFSRRQLLKLAKDRDLDVNASIDEVLRQLYQAGAISNLDRRGRVNFLYAQSTGELDVHTMMTLQRTFARGLNRAPLWMAGVDDIPPPAKRTRRRTRGGGSS